MLARKKYEILNQATAILLINDLFFSKNILTEVNIL